MKIDAYTRAVLTVIAICLLWLSVDRLLERTPVYAQGVQRVVLSGVEYNVNGSPTFVPFRAGSTPNFALVPVTH
jgi:hypothetical protein